MFCRMYLALKMHDSSEDLVVSVVRVIFFIVGRNGSGESRVSDEPSCSVKRYRRIRTCLSGEVESSSSPIRRQAPDVRYLNRVERWPDRMAKVKHLGGMSDDFRPGGTSYVTRRKTDVCVSKREEATWQFLGREDPTEVSEEPEGIGPEGRAFTERTRDRGEFAGSQATFARKESLRQQPVSPV